MKENDKKIIIRIMNSIAFVGNIIAIILIPVIYFLSNYIEEYSEILKKFESGDISIVAKIILLVLCCIFNIINLFLSKNLKKNESKISFFTIITMMIGSVYNVLAGFVSLIIIYKKKKRRKRKQ